MTFSNAVSPNATVHFTFFVPLATLLSLRVLPEFKKKAVWTRAYGWWRFGGGQQHRQLDEENHRNGRRFSEFMPGVVEPWCRGSRGMKRYTQNWPLDRCMPGEGGIASVPRPVGTETRTWIFFSLAGVQPEDCLCGNLTTLSSPHKF